jgi:hypothetical protein
MKTPHLELHAESLPNGVAVEAHAHGTLDGTDYDALLPELDALMKQGRPLSFLLFMDDFHGWDLESLARELKWDLEHRGRVRKVAVVGDKAWEKWTVMLSAIFLPGNVRYFPRAESDEARTWVQTFE